MSTTISFVLLVGSVAASPGIVALESILDSIESKVVALARKIEQQHAARCDLEYESCEGSMWDSCTSSLPAGRCDAGVRTPLCGALCGMTFDYTVSAVTLPPGSDRLGISIADRLKETACYTNPLEPMFLANNEEFNSTGLFSVLPNQYFGDRHGLFRMYPGRHFEKW